MDNPLVSICITAYNAEAYIQECLDSILNQTYNNIEIIVVNDGSKDNTTAILETYIIKGVTVINQSNKGQCAAANKAFRASSGFHIKFMDSDDIISKNFIESQVMLLHKKNNSLALASWGRFYNNDLRTFKLNQESDWKNMKPIDWLVKSLEKNNNMMQCALWLIPRSILKKTGLWNEDLSLINDFEFFIRLLLASDKVFFTKDAILYYRSGILNSLSNQKTKKALESAFLSTTLGIKAILKFENSNRTRKVCADVMQNWAYQFYPSKIELYKKSILIIHELGGSDFKFPAGGKTKMMVKLIGWKLTKRLKNYFK